MAGRSGHEQDQGSAAWVWLGYRVVGPWGAARSPRIAAWDRKTVRRYVEARAGNSVCPATTMSALSMTGLIGAVADAVSGPAGWSYGAAWS